MGLIREPTATPLLDTLLENPLAQSWPLQEAHVGGKRVLIVKGTNLESEATGTHRIKGSPVEIN